MTIRYVGKGGSDSADGLSWANRKLTLNGVEDSPVQAGDTVYVGPGTYRERLNADVDGTSGNLITYIGDYTGVHTDGVGGLVTISASDNDYSSSESYAIHSGFRDYRKWVGFAIFSGTFAGFNSQDTTYEHVEDCVFFGGAGTAKLIRIVGSGSKTVICKNCIFIGSNQAISFDDTGAGTHVDSVIDNCLFIGAAGGGTPTYGIYSLNNDKVVIRNCTFIGLDIAIYVSGLPDTIGYAAVVNCLFDRNGTALASDGSGSGVLENYNNIPATNVVARSSVSTGGQSTSYPNMFTHPILHETMSKFPWIHGELAANSYFKRITGSSTWGAPSDDLYGIARPVTNGKMSWGAIQYSGVERETTTVHNTSLSSVKLADAGTHQIFLPVKNASTTVSVYCYRETNYAGTLPQLVIKEPGAADRTDTDTGSSGSWNQLSINFTPASNVNFVVVELKSNNTATSGSYSVFFDTMGVS